MGDSILLASQSTLLTITLRHKDCSFWLSRDQKALIFDETDGRSISGMDVKLMRDSDKEMLSSLLIPIRSPSSFVSIRIDAFLPLIFGCGFSLDSADTKENSQSCFVTALANCDRKDVTKFFINIDLHFTRNSLSDLFGRLSGLWQPAEIYTDSLKIGSTSLAVSRELLSIHSDYFSNLFYGSFIERYQEVKEIKEIAEPEFVAFIQSLHRRRFVFNSAKQALDSLQFADRFLIPNISKHILPYLKKNRLPENLLQYALAVVDKVPNNKDILEWIMTQFPSKAKLLDTLHDTVPSMSSDTIQSSLKRVRELDQLEGGQDYGKMRNLIGSLSQYGNVGFHMLGYDTTRTKLEDEEYFTCQFNTTYQMKGVVNRFFWTQIPEKYSYVTVNGAQFVRGELLFINLVGGCAPAVLKIHAYRN